jgi:DNA mismatch endonuclease, patch repair protein
MAQVSLTRSELMSRVRQHGTAPEKAVARFLASHGFRFRCNVRGLPGTPDLLNKRGRIAVFVHGCFWHRHRGCKRTTTPKSNQAFWLAKFEANMRRDRMRTRQLKRSGYKVVVVWECQTRSDDALEKALLPILDSDFPKRARSRP